MKSRIHSRSLLAAFVMAGTTSTMHATVLTWNGNAGDTWDTTTSQWLDGGTPAIWNSATPDSAAFGAAGAGNITVGAGITADDLAFDASGYTLGGGTLTLSGSPTITTNADAAIGSALAGTAGLNKTGAGTLILSGANTYSGPTTITAGTLTVSAGSYIPATASLLTVGGATGKGVFNKDNSGTANFTSASTPGVGGNGGAADTGAGAINQSAGTLNLMSGAAIYLTIGNNGGGNAYGSVRLSGGTLTTTSGSGIRLGYQGLGSLAQTGGTLNCGRWFVIGGGSTTGKGVATFSGGAATVNSGFRINLSDNAAANGTLNLGTAAGGNAVLTALHNSGSGTIGGVNLMAVANGTTALNLNSGTLTLGGPVYKGNAGNSSLNLNGATLKANSSGITLISNTNSLAGNLYNGGLTVDTQAHEATIAASLLATTGNGIYPAGGVLNMTTPGGAGYIGAPLVTVTTSGAGTGASAVANVINGQVTGVTLTCPGQGYTAGDTVTFAFAGGGATSAAADFVHTLAGSDLAANGTGGLTKLGSGVLTLTGNNTFTGPIAVTGTLVSEVVSLSNTTIAVNSFNPASLAPVQVRNSLITGGTVQVAVNGSLSPGTWPLIEYPIGSSISGDGFGAFQLQTSSLPRGVVASLVHNTTNYSVDLNITQFNPLTWKASVNNQWDINSTANWTIGTNAEKYNENDIVLFDDSVGTGSTSVVLDATVSPASVSFANQTKNYTLGGSGSISGNGGLTKSGSGTVTILNTNTFSGVTTVAGGTLQLGNGSDNGSIAGPLANEATVVFNPAGSSSYAGDVSGSGSGVFIKAGIGTQILTGGNLWPGPFQISAGTLQIGNGSVSGNTGSSQFEIASGATLRLDRATATAPTWANINGNGTLALNTATSGDWGNLALAEGFTGTLRVEKGRVGTNGGSGLLGGASKIEILSGAQFLAFASVDPYTVPIEIAGTGWGETGYPGGLRLAATGNATATWAGNVTLTADSGIMAQRGANFTVTGSITGAYQCEFYAGDPAGDSGTLVIAPADPAQNSYASTRINGRPNASIVAGNALAFSQGPLTVDNAILKLNGNSLTFSNLSGTGGRIGNYHTTTPATLTVGDNSDTAFSGGILDGGSSRLGLTKTGTGTLTLTGMLSYTGETTISQGTLSIGSTTLDDNATVTIATGAKIHLPNAGLDTVGKLVLGGIEVPAGTYDASHPTYGTYFSGTGSLVVAGGYSSWADAMGLDGTPGKENGLNDDPDNDGIDNLMEFYLNGNPLASDPSILPSQSLDGTYLTLTFSRRDDAEADVASQAVQYGSNLSGWTSVPAGTESSGPDGNGVIVTVVENGTSPDTITVRIPRTQASGGRLFGRLRISK